MSPKAPPQTPSDKFEKARQAAASLKYSLIYQYIIGGLLGIFFLRYLAISFRRFLSRRRHRSLSPQAKISLAEKGSSKASSVSTLQSISTSWIIRPFEVVEEFAQKPVFGGEWTWTHLIITAFIVGINIAFCLVVDTTLVTVATVNSNIARAFSRRCGRIAVANFPILYALSGRNNLVSFVTGIPYQEVKFVHKLLGVIVTLETLVHTFAYTGYYITSLGLALFAEEYTELYFKMGIVATVGTVMLAVFSIRWIRSRCYELFLITHVIGAAFMLVGTWYHRPITYNYIYASVAFWAFERVARVVGHMSSIFNSRLVVRQPIITASATICSDAILLRVPFGSGHWMAGQHCYVSFWGMDLLKTPWLYGQSHPFSICNMPNTTSEQQTLHFVLKIRDGMTKTLAKYIRDNQTEEGSYVETKVSLEGPYGYTAAANDFETVLLIAGGSGITHIASTLADVASKAKDTSTSAVTRLKLVWAIQHLDQKQWIGSTLKEVRQLAIDANLSLELDLYVTQPDSPTSTPSESSNDILEKPRSLGDGISLHEGRPDVADIMRSSIADCEGKTIVFACGPEGISSAVRNVAGEFSSRDVEISIAKFEY